MSARPGLVQEVVACIFTETGRVTLNNQTLKVGEMPCTCVPL